MRRVPLDLAEAPAAEDEEPGLHPLDGLADGLLGVALHDGRRGLHLPLPAQVQGARQDLPGVLLIMAFGSAAAGSKHGLNQHQRQAGTCR